MIIEGVPPVEEVQKYNSAMHREDDAGNDLSALMAALPGAGSSGRVIYEKGDKVVITKGEWERDAGAVRGRIMVFRGVRVVGCSMSIVYVEMLYEWISSWQSLALLD